MRVLVTGATGSFGTPICRALAHRGVEVLAMARNEPSRLPPGVSFIRGDVQDRDSIERAVDGVDTVLHLAWLVASAREAEQAERINIVGTQNVLDVMRERGVPRFVFASSVMGYGSDADHGPYREDEPLRAAEGFLYGYHKKLVEARIKESGVPHLVVRTAPVVGRGVRNVVTDQFAGPAVTGMAGDSSLWQFVHTDDVTRFLIEAAYSDVTGVVNLAADGGLTLERVGELLRKPVVRLPYTVAKAMIGAMWKAGISDVDPAALNALRHLPIADTTMLRERFGFRCAWSNDDAVADMRRSLMTYLHFGTLEARRLSHVPFTEPGWRPDMSPLPGQELVLAGQEEWRGEFDEPIDATTYSALGSGDAPYITLKPLALEVTLLALRAAGAVAGRLLGLDRATAHEAQSRIVAAIGHRVYLNVAVVADIQKRAPWLPEGLSEFIPTWDKAVRAGRLALNGGVALARYGLSEQWLVDEADRVTAAVDLSTLTDAELGARLALMLDTFVDSAVITVNAALAGGGGSFAEHIAFVAGALAERPPTAAGGRGRRWDRVRDASAAVARQLREVLQERGYRMTESGVLENAADVWLVTIDEIAYPPADIADRVTRRRRRHKVLTDVDLPSSMGPSEAPRSTP